MQDDDVTFSDLNDDFNDDSDTSDVDNEKIDVKKVDSRRKLEDYLEKKKLNDDFDYY